MTFKIQSTAFIVDTVWELELLSSLARVCNSGSLYFTQTSIAGDLATVRFWGAVRYSAALSARRNLNVLDFRFPFIATFVVVVSFLV